MLISIIIPIYNVEEYIEECLESVYQQNYPNIEVVLVNDCTPDGSMTIAQHVVNKYKDKYPTIIINHKENKGISEARNCGMKVAKGEYIYFIDSDDAIMPGAIHAFVDVAIRHKGIELIEGKYIHGVSYIPILVDNIHEKIVFDDDCKINFLMPKMFTSCNILLKRSFIQEHSISFVPGIIYEDNLFRYTIAKHLSFAGEILQNTYFYRKNRSSCLHNITIKHIHCAIQNLIFIENNLFAHPKIRKRQTRQFIEFTLHYWEKRWRIIDGHHASYPVFADIVRVFLRNNFKELGITNIIILSPALFPYQFAQIYVKMIWKFYKLLRL